MDTFTVQVGGLRRTYPIVTLSPGIRGVYFFLPGDVDLIETCATLLCDRLGDRRYDVIVSAEAGGIPLAHAMARRLGCGYLVLRKSVKPYMDRPLVEEVRSITTDAVQTLVLDSRDIAKLREKDALIVDDIVSTGGTIAGAMELARQAGGRPVAIATVFLEGDARAEDIMRGYGCEIAFLGHLPVFRSPAP